MLGPLAFVAVRQKQGQAAQTAPFRFTAADELINDHLRSVGKVTELGFPNNQCTGLSGGIAIFKR